MGLTLFGLDGRIHCTFVQHMQEVKVPSIGLDLILGTVTAPLFSDLRVLIGSSSVSETCKQKPVTVRGLTCYGRYCNSTLSKESI